MKKEISEELLVKWVDNALNSDESRELDALLKDDPSLQESLDGMRAAREMIRKEIPASVDPPYPDFFNSQLMRKVELEKASHQPKETAQRWWKGFQWAWAPAGAMALVLAFLAGQRLGPEEGNPVAVVQQAGEQPSVYFSEDSLNADIISDADGNISVIVVNGLDAISDDESFAQVGARELPVSYQRSEVERFH